MKKTVIILYFVVVAVMAAATIVEKYQGTEFVSDHIYGAWWFSALWALLTVAGITYFVRTSRLASRTPVPPHPRTSVILLHLSFVVILAGALLTHLTARRGLVLLREGETQQQYMTRDMELHALPFAVTLKSFEIQYYEGTDAPRDYVSHLVIDGRPFTVSMNRIASHRGVRLYQSSYDEDLRGSILTMNSDPWGIPVTYTGYGLLFLSLLWVLIDPRGRYRQLLRRVSAAAVLCVVCLTAHSAPRTLPAETAERFGQLFVVYNDRVCPMQTYALDFTKKLYGRRSYQGFTAEQVLTGFIFYYDDWVAEPLKQDSKPMKMAEKQMLIEQLHRGTPVRVFPYAADGRVTWYAPTSTLPDNMDSEHRKYMRDVFARLNGEVQAGRFAVANQYLDRLLQYQQNFGRQSLPSPLRVRAERLYNQVPLPTILFICCLTLGFLLFFVGLFRPTWLRSSVPVVLLALAWAALTVCLALRWIVTGTVPMSNGYETMLVLAWFVMLLSVLLWRRFPIMITFGFLLSGFLLLVSHISQMDPVMTHLMPVLNSPLLTLHVSVIMMAYALLSLTFVAALTALIAPAKRDEMQLLSQLMLYPALVFLGYGIFIGAIWANVSWGTYWSWDPKETWALITFMVYAVPLHPSFFASRTPAPSRPRTPLYYHLYILLAFLTLLMTYFGVNYFLGGMHSYA